MPYATCFFSTSVFKSQQPCWMFQLGETLLSQTFGETLCFLTSPGRSEWQAQEWMRRVFPDKMMQPQDVRFLGSRISWAAAFFRMHEKVTSKALLKVSDSSIDRSPQKPTMLKVYHGKYGNSMQFISVEQLWICRFVPLTTLPSNVRQCYPPGNQMQLMKADSAGIEATSESDKINPYQPDHGARTFNISDSDLQYRYNALVYLIQRASRYLHPFPVARIQMIMVLLSLTYVVYWDTEIYVSMIRCRACFFDARSSLLQFFESWNLVSSSRSSLAGGGLA